MQGTFMVGLEKINITKIPFAQIFCAGKAQQRLLEQLILQTCACLTVLDPGVYIKSIWYMTFLGYIFKGKS